MVHCIRERALIGQRDANSLHTIPLRSLSENAIDLVNLQAFRLDFILFQSVHRSVPNGCACSLSLSLVMPSSR